MNRVGLITVCLALGMAASSAWAQAPLGGGAGQGGEQVGFKLPEDPKLVEIHKNFVLAAEKLAGEYERSNQMDKARACYQEILRLVPTYEPAQQKIDAIREKESTAQRKVMDILATGDWQDTGLECVEGKPIIITANGKWTFRMTYDLDANGIPIPQELRDFNLGALVGVIATPEDVAAARSGQAPRGSAAGTGNRGPGGRFGGPGRTGGGEEEGPGFKPFFVGSSLEMNAPKSGRLLLRMYDGDPSDNTGKMTVTITGTFAGGR